MSPGQNLRRSFRDSAGCGERGSVFDVLMFRRMAVRTAAAAGLRAGAQRLIDDGLDGARAAAAFGAAAETAVNLLGVARELLRTLDGTADVVVANHVAGTDDH